MENMNSTDRWRYSGSSRNWWLLLLLGIASIIIGFLIFRYPGVSYVQMALIFGLLILASGIIQIVFAASEKNISGRGWILAGGIIELIIGLILSFNLSLSASTLPFFLGFWLLFRGFSLIGVASDMNTMRMRGMGWTIVTAILLIICAFIILIHPLIYGVEAVVIWVGAAFIVAGISLIAFAIRLKRLGKNVTDR